MKRSKGLVLCVLALTLVVTLFSFAGCTQKKAGELVDGWYSAQVKEPDNGWREYITICVNNGKIVAVDYDARNASGFIKAWDSDYMRLMNASDHTYPNEYMRFYESEFLEAQSVDIDALSGATHSYNSFKLLAQAVIEQAAKGENGMVIVDVPASKEGE